MACREAIVSIEPVGRFVEYMLPVVTLVETPFQGVLIIIAAGDSDPWSGCRESDSVG